MLLSTWTRTLPTEFKPYGPKVEQCISPKVTHEQVVLMKKKRKLGSGYIEAHLMGLEEAHTSFLCAHVKKASQLT